MRICLISREFPPETGWGGIGAYTYQHANALAELGHDVEVIALTSKEARGTAAVTNGAHNPELHNIPVYRATWGDLLEDLSTIWISIPYSHYVMKTTIALWSKFHQRHKEKPFDVVEAPEHLAEGIFPCLTKVCPVVIRLHTPHFKFVAEGFHNLKRNFDQEFVGLLERTAMLSAELLSSPSQELAGYVAKECGLDNSAITIVRNPVDATRFCPEGNSMVEREEGQVTVVFAGRLEQRKGIYNLIDCVPMVLQKCQSVRFIIAGSDTQTGPGKTSVLADLERRLKANGCAHAVQFLKQVPLDSMPDVYRSGDICVVPSLYDNASCTVLEAMSCGKPVIGTSAGGTPEYVLHERTGLIIAPDDTTALCHAIVELATDARKRTAFSANARACVLESFQRSIIASKAVDTYLQAQERFKTTRQMTMYRKPPAEAFDDITRMLYYYHQNLYQLIYLHSIRFRIKHWIGLAAKRPKLCLGYLLSWLAAPLARLTGAPTLLDATVRLHRFLEQKEVEKDNAFFDSMKSARDLVAR